MAVATGLQVTAAMMDADVTAVCGRKGSSLLALSSAGGVDPRDPGIVPLLTGAFDVHVFGPPFRMPSQATRFVGCHAVKADGDGHGLSAGGAAALSRASSMRGTNLGVRAA
jgi:hypothetical protein